MKTAVLKNLVLALTLITSATPATALISSHYMVVQVSQPSELPTTALKLASHIFAGCRILVRHQVKPVVSAEIITDQCQNPSKNKQFNFFLVHQDINGSLLESEFESNRLLLKILPGGGLVVSEADFHTHRTQMMEIKLVPKKGIDGQPLYIPLGRN